ncbi:MAG TPA: L,D-transpeptidase family protein [Actinomycetota bacterium]|nr:L,D-transpeptidase family protein [Actinomycetota bacterium]
MRRAIVLLTVVTALVPAIAVFGMVQAKPSSAYVVPDVQIATESGPVRLSAEELGVRRADDGRLRVDDHRFETRLGELVAGLGEPAVPGRYELTPDGVRLVEGTPGLALDMARTREVLLAAMDRGRGRVTLPLAETEAPPPPRFAIVVFLSEFRLDLYEGTGLVKSYPVGVGALRFPTPPGAYFIRSKAKNPTWRNPGSGWARSMPAVIGPGPKNPLGSRAMRLDREALVIHGTPNPASVGRRSSHGCIRMRKADVEDLFERVPVGTEVFIVP